MRNLSRVLIIAAAGVLIAGCAGQDIRSGKGNDHEAAYRLGDRDDRKVVYVEREPRVVYVQPAQPSYVYYPPAPVYQPAPVSRTVVPVTRYYYVD